MIELIISGGQTGADIAGLEVGLTNNIRILGWAPKNFMMKDGPNPDLLKGKYGLQEHKGGYKERTYENVKCTDATIRCCVDFYSAGEICTLNAIKQFKKPHFDIYLLNPPSIQDFVIWILRHNIKRLNVAGNTQNKKGVDIFKLTYEYLHKSIRYLDRIMKEGR